MYKLDFNKSPGEYELRELIRMFIPSTEFEILTGDFKGLEEGDKLIKIPDEITDKEAGKRFIYDTFKQITGKDLAWGTLTGVRPVKLTGELFEKYKDKEGVLEALETIYYVRRDKADLLVDVRLRQEAFLADKDEKLVALYIGIPFCPTRCLYCSFPSYTGTEDRVKAYLKALYQEIDAIGRLMAEKGLYPESIYIGGGTPTSLSAKQLADLTDKINKSFDLTRLKEYTLEAGRPDTITTDKLLEIKDKGVDRISINPQTTKEKTLDLIGRCHSNQELYQAFDIANKIGFKAINADLIAGLPGESVGDFEKSLKDIIELEPDNITVHTLSVKRSSRLKKDSPLYSYGQDIDWEGMLETGSRLLNKQGYKPYYLYRQKQMVNNLENVGYSLPGKEGIYNIRIMEEHQTILALGAGAVSKICYPRENRLERVPNVSNYEVYIDRIDQMIERKRKEIG